MSTAVAPSHSGAGRLWDTDPFLLLDWDSASWRGTESTGLEWGTSEWTSADRGGAPGVSYESGAGPDAEWDSIVSDWSPRDRVSAPAGGRGGPVPPQAPPSAGSQLWQSAPEWLLPDWLVTPETESAPAGLPAPRRGALPVDETTDLPLPRRRDVRRAERTGEIPIPSRRELRAARGPRASRPRLASVALGAVAARVAVLTVLGAVGAAAVTGYQPGFLRDLGDGNAEGASADLAMPGAAGVGLGARFDLASLQAAQVDYTDRREAIEARIDLEDRGAVAASVASKIIGDREEARLKAAAEAAAKARAEAKERAMRQARENPKAIAKVMVEERGWSATQWVCLDNLWTRESNWNYQAQNPSSGAYGIPQSLPGTKMAAAGSDWRTNPVTQIEWGLDYIADRYGTPCGAWAHSEDVGWY